MEGIEAVLRIISINVLGNVKQVLVFVDGEN